MRSNLEARSVPCVPCVLPCIAYCAPYCIPDKNDTGSPGMHNHPGTRNSLYLPVLSSSRRFAVFYGGYGISHDFTVLTNSRQWLYVVPCCAMLCHTQAIQPVQVDGRFCSPTPLWPYVLHECQRVSLIVDSHILRTSPELSDPIVCYLSMLIIFPRLDCTIRDTIRNTIPSIYSMCICTYIYRYTHACARRYYQ